MTTSLNPSTSVNSSRGCAPFNSGYRVTVSKGWSAHHASMRTDSKIREVVTITDEVRRMIRGAIGGAFLGGFSGSLAGFVGTLMVGLEPVVFLACGVYAGVVYGGIV